MGFGSSPPPAPDPVATANAQAAANTKAAQTQQQINMVDQVTPYGNLNYQQLNNWNDGTPRFQATTSLSPEQQNLYNLGTQTQSNLGNIGVEQSQKVRDILNTPFDINSSANTQQSDIARTLLDPVWKQREGALQTQLANQGIGQGSEAYTNALRDFGMQRDNAYNSALLSGRQQSVTEALAQRNQPLNEIGALLSNSQVQQPNFASTPTAQVSAPDIGGMTYQSYQMGPLAAWQNQQQQKQAMMGGVMGMGGAALGGWGMGGFKKPGFLG